MSTSFNLTDYIKHEFIPKLEKDHGITILLAVESGSRMWGFPSPDSDYDIRFIYRHRDLRNHFSVSTVRQVIDQKDPNPLVDATGWSLEKAIRLMGTGNGTLVDWLNSGIVYKSVENAVPLLKMLQAHVLAQQSNRIRFLHHHRSLCSSTYKLAHDSARDPTKLSAKKFLYSVRSALIVKWGLPVLGSGYSWADPPVTIEALRSRVLYHIAQTSLDYADMDGELTSLVGAKSKALEKSATVDVADVHMLTDVVENVISEVGAIPTIDKTIVYDPMYCTSVLRALIA